MNDSAVVLDRVSLTYHEPHAETLAIDQLSLCVQEGEFVAIVGPSGCGKSSMLSLLMGLIAPSGGSIRLMGESVAQAGGKVGYMLQRDHLLDWRTVEGNVLLGLEIKHMLDEQTRQYAMSLLRTYGLEEFIDHYPHQLSGGMRQKVALIRTLAFHPEILLLDEPFSALDYQTRLRIADEIHAIIKKEHKTAILVTHDISEAISMSDRVIVFTQRPAKVKSEHVIALHPAQTPLARRGDPAFRAYFDSIWKELNTDEA